MTNGDYIRSLADEELVFWIDDSHCPEDADCKVGKSCTDCWLEWLRMPCEEEE